MPLATHKNSEGLSFEIDRPCPYYLPGDNIAGRVILNTADDAAIGKVAVTFYGRVKSRIIQHHGQSTTVHRGRVKLFEFETLLYEGVYTHKQGTFTWPFNFTVPTKATPETILAGEKFKPKAKYISTEDALSLDLTLPASVYNSRDYIGRQVECYVEYVLEATVSEPEGQRYIRKAKSKSSHYPIIFRPLPPPTPIEDFNLVASSRTVTISSLKLLPENANTSLGFRDRARSIFSRDSVPKFCFDIKVEVPTTIQTFHPNPIPFLITATPGTGGTTLDPSLPSPEITLKAASVALKVFVECRAPGVWSDTKTYTIPLLKDRILNQPLTLTPATSLSGVESPSATAPSHTLDLGRLADLRVGNAKLGSRIESPLTPSFTSFNVSRHYQLTWSLEIAVADKTETLNSKTEMFTRRKGEDVAVVGPPESGGVEARGYAEGEAEDDNALTAADSGESERSSGISFWRRPRRSGEGSTGEKEKPVVLSAETTGESARERKEREARAERERNLAPERDEAPPRFETGYQHPFSDQPLQVRGRTEAEGEGEGEGLPKYQP